MHSECWSSYFGCFCDGPLVELVRAPLLDGLQIPNVRARTGSALSRDPGDVSNGLRT